MNDYRHTYRDDTGTRHLQRGHTTMVQTYNKQIRHYSKWGWHTGRHTSDISHTLETLEMNLGTRHINMIWLWHHPSWRKRSPSDANRRSPRNSNRRTHYQSSPSHAQWDRTYSIKTCLYQAWTWLERPATTPHHSKKGTLDSENSTEEEIASI